MATRDDGNQIGVEPDDTRDKYKQANLSTNYACGKLGDHPLLSGLKVQYRMAIGIMPASEEYVAETAENVKNWVWVVAYRIDKNSPVELMATVACFGYDTDDSEFEGLPRKVSWDEFLQHGFLFGRFEKASWDDLTWYFLYCKDNNESWPAANISFPSAAAGGPDGRRGEHRDGKAVVVQV